MIEKGRSPAYLVEALLHLPEPARTELRKVIDGTLIPLAQIRENGYRIPKPTKPPTDFPYSRDDFDDIISELQALATLLEDEQQD
jgi:hypothetical protein